MLRIRDAAIEDAETISRIVCLCYEGFGRTDDYPDDVIRELKRRRGSVKCMGELIRDENVFVAEDNGQIRGMVSVRQNEITKLYVDPYFQGQGTGKMLFNRAESFIKSREYRKMFLGAAAKTPVSFYESMGMRITRKRTIDHGPCIGMTSIVLEKIFSDSL